MEEKLFNGFAFSCKSIVFLQVTFAFPRKTFVMEVIQGGRKTMEHSTFVREWKCFVSKCRVSQEKAILFWESAKAFFLPPLIFFSHCHAPPPPTFSAQYFSVFHVLKWKGFSLFSGCVWLNRSSHVVASYPDNQTHLPFISSLQCDALQVNKMYFHLIVIKS